MDKLKMNVLTFLFVLTACFQNGWSQEGYTIVTRDLESWSSVGLRFKPNKKFSLQYEQGLRLNHNSTIVDQLLSDLSMKIRPVKYLEFGAGFRYIKDRGGNDLFDNDFRFNFDAAVRHKVDRFSFKYRLRYQNRNELGLSRAEGDNHKQYLRFKVGVNYNIKDWKLDPNLSAEIFRNLDGTNGGFDNLRFTLGSAYDFKKFGKLGFYYRIERELGVTYPKTTSILGLNYVYTIKTKKKDEK
ncbi:MAG: DUF2490 domain-containing protein [Flavobacteriales bacterium]|nr:DUF2490 domain-containing protein [Flavobacteriales bacterium]